MKASVSQISEAIVELNEGKHHFPLIVNPVSPKNVNGIPTLNYKGWYCHVSELRFHVAVTEVKSHEDGIGASLKVLGFNHKKGREDENVTTIDFPIYVVFPTIKTEPGL